MSKLVVGLALLVVVLGGVGTISLSYIQKSPQYSVYQIYKSVKNRDYQNFVKYVDVDTAVTNVTTSYLQTAKQSVVGLNCNDQTNWGKCLGANIVANLDVKKLVEERKPQVDEALNQAITTGNYFDIASFHLDNPLLDFTTLKVTPQKDGTVIVDVPNDKNTPISLKLQKEGGAWKVVDVTSDVLDFNQFLQPGVKF